jgi:invasion protein IalB
MPVIRKFRALVVGVVIAAASSAVAPSGALAASAKDGDKFGDWTVACSSASNAAAQVCRLMQVEPITGKDGKPVSVLKAAVFHMSAKELVLFGYLPLGYTIAPGVKVSVDGGKAFQMYAQRCIPQGCEVALKLDGTFLAQMKKGRQAKIEFHIGDRTGTIAVSLKGLNEALSKF